MESNSKYFNGQALEERENPGMPTMRKRERERERKREREVPTLKGLTRVGKVHGGGG